MQAQFTTTTNNGTITITGYAGSGGAVTIPSTINGFPVTSIGAAAFDENGNLTSVTIPNSITNIGDYAFAYGSLTGATIGTNVLSIGQNAFHDCINLANVVIPNSVVTIGDYAFSSCFSLTSITIPNSITNIGLAPFDGCPLTAINVNSGNPAYISVGGVLFSHDQTMLVEYPGGNSQSSYSIPSTITDIANSSFANCFNLTNVTIPNSVTNIEASSFLNCTGLKSITIPASVTTIGSSGGGAFEDCTSLTQVYFLGNEPSAGSYVFESDGNLAAVYYLPGATGWGPTFSGVAAIELANYTIMVNASPSGGGSVSGGGSFPLGGFETVTASANVGYTFANWTEIGIVVSPTAHYGFTLGGNVSLTANFTPNPTNYTITLSASPGGGGTVSGAGTFVSGTSQTVTATANNGYSFVNWTANGSAVSWSSSYTFALNSNVNLTANFEGTPFVMYVPGSAGSIMKITSAGVVSTLVPVYTFGGTIALAVDTNGNVYIANGAIYKVTPSGVMSTFASGFSEPTGLAFDPAGNLYVADFGNGTVSKVTPTGAITNFASGFSSDPDLGGNGNLSVACDGNGNVFVADYDTGIVSKITSAGVKSVFADGMSYLFSVTTDPGGNVYVADFNGTVTKFTPAGVVSTLATVSWYATGLGFDSGGNLYVSHVGNNAIAELTPAGVVSTFMSGYSGPIAIFSAPNPPVITTQPQNQGLIAGQAVPAVFNAAAGGQNIGYQWSISTNGGATWTTLTNGSNYNGAQSATLAVANATGGFSGYEYECTATNAQGSATSSPAVLTNVPFLLYVADEINNTISTFTPDGHGTLLSGGLNHPLAIATDAAGNIYVAEQGDNTVAKISTAGGVSTFASGVYQPDGLAFDASGNLYVADSISGSISKVTLAGAVSTFASGLSQPSGLAFDGAGNLYVANSGNNTVSEITPAGGVSLFASGFGYPAGLVFDGGGNLYIANLSSNTVSKVTPAGGVSTFASGFNEPMGLTFDGNGNLYVANYANSSVGGTISRVTPSGVVTTFLGNMSDLVAISAVIAPAPPTITIQPQNETLPVGENAVFTIDASGAPGSNTFRWQVSTDGGGTWSPLANNVPYAGVATPTLTVSGAISGYEFECVVTNAYGSATSNPAMLIRLPFLMYVANASSSVVSAITPAGTASTFVSSMSGALAVDINGNLYVANEGNGTVSKFTPTGVSSTLASGFNEPAALACDTTGNVYVANDGNGTISKITPAGVTNTFASGFGDPTALACDANGNLYVADYDYSTISKITPGGAVSLYATDVFNPGGLAFDASGNLYEANLGGLVEKITTAGVVTTFASGLYNPHGLAFDGSGNLYVINGNGPISMVSPGGVVSTFVSGLGDLISVAIITAPIPPTMNTYTIAVSASPSAAGTVTGGGSFPSGSLSLQTVTAQANSGYIFANWTENGRIVSVAPEYTFTLGGNITLIANFYSIAYQTLNDPSAGSAAGEGTYATGISGGNIVGYYQDVNNHADGFVSSGNTYITLLDPNADDDTVANGISGGNIVGTFANGSSHGFIFSGGIYTTYSYFDGLYGNAGANGINGANVVGSFPDDNGTHGWLYNGSTYTTLDDPNSYPIYELGYLSVGADTSANGISGGSIVGYYHDSVGNGVHGFLFTNGNYTTLDAPGGVGSTYALGIDGTNIVGYFTDSSAKTHGFLFNGADYTILDDPNGVGSTFARGISGNTIVGNFLDSNGVSHAFSATMALSQTISYTANPSQGVTPLTVQFACPGFDSGGNVVVNWSWSFGDGYASTAQNPSHIYTNAGTFQPVLTVTNNLGLTVNGFGPAISVSVPSIVFTAVPTNGTSPMSVQFGSPGVDSGGNTITHWSWSFGDGSGSSVQNPSHVYSNSGAFHPSLNATNNLGLAVNGSGPAISVSAPSVVFTATPTNGTSPLTVQFACPGVDSGGNTITHWSWNFGDGGTSSSQNPSHVYSNTGAFLPSLNATNSLGAAVNGSGPAISVSAPSVVFLATPTNGTSPLTVQFACPGVDSGGNTIAHWSWNFGDGSAGTVQNPSHVYANAGTFYPTLAATNSLGGTVTVVGNIPITVTNAIVVFNASPTNGAPPLTVQFNSPPTDSAGRTVVNWNWTFGDGGTANVQNPSHTYTNSGLYSPALAATDSLGGAVIGSGPRILAGFSGGLVVNGGFETGDFTGWTESGNFSDSSVTSASTYVHSGEYGAELGPVGTLGYLSQTLPTVAGNQYQLSFWLNSSGATPSEFLAAWNGTNLMDRTNIGAVGWTNIQFSVSATGTNTTLKFGFRDDPSYLGLDDVSVVAVSPPLATLSPVNFSATSGFQLSVYGQNGQAYTLQASTNLVTWVSLTNITCTNSPMQVVDPQARNYSRRFYRLVQGTLPIPMSPVVLGFALSQPLSGNGLALMLQGPIGSNYLIQASTDLVTWLPITNFSSTNSPVYFSDPSAANYGRRFYRAVEQ